MTHKIKELINDGYIIEFGPGIREEMHITISKNMHHARYILSYSDLKNSVLDPDVVICQILDHLESKVNDEILNKIKIIFKGD